MARHTDNIPDPDDDGTGTASTPGGGGSTTPPGGPRPTATAARAPGAPPIAPLTSGGGTPTDPLDRAMSAYRESYLGRMRNLGAGGNFFTGVSSVLTGGALGSYGLNAKGSIQRTIDEITAERSGIDFNATTRVINIRKSSEDQIYSLGTKIRVCEEMESTIENELARQKELVDAMKAVKATPPDVLKHKREEITTTWEKIKAHPITQDMKRVGIRGGVGFGSALLIGATLGLSPLGAIALVGGLPAGVALAIRKIKQNPDGSGRERDELASTRALISTIRSDAEARRKELMDHYKRKYAGEAKRQEAMREYFTKDITKIVSENDAKELLLGYESLIHSRDPKKVNNLIELMRSKKKTDGKDAFSSDELDLKDQDLTLLFSKNGVAYFNAVDASIGLLEANGPVQTAALIKRISQVNTDVPQSGREIELTIGGEKKKYKIEMIAPYSENSSEIHLREVTDPPTKDLLYVQVAFHNHVNAEKHGKKVEVTFKMHEVPTETLIKEMKMKNEDDLTCSDPHAHPSVSPEDAKKQKKLLALAKKQRLSVGDYRKLWDMLRKPPENYEKNGVPLIHAIATGPNNVFEQKKVDKVSTENLIAELSTRTERDLKVTGNSIIDNERKKLLARAQTERLTVADYKKLWGALLEPPSHYEQNDLPLVHGIVTGSTNADDQISVDKVSTEDLIAEISVKTEYDLSGKTETELAEQKQLLDDAKVRRLSVAEYKKLWNALKPKPHWARNNLPLIQEIAESPSNTFEQVRVYKIPTQDLIAEMQHKSETDLYLPGPASEDTRRKQLLAAAQARRLSHNDYMKLWSVFIPPALGRIGLTHLKEVCSRDTFEQIDVPKVDDKALIAEASTKSESDLIGGTPAEIAEQKQLLADAQAGRLTVAQYRELWKALKPPKSFGQYGGLTEVKKIVDSKNADGEKATEYKFKETKMKNADTMKIT